MGTSKTTKARQYSLAEATRARVASYLYALCANEQGLFSNVDRWTQRRITDESMAKLALVFESGDPVEACYRDLIREIDAEAESGIYLASSDAPTQHLRRIVDEPGVSGNLAAHINEIAITMFADELMLSEGGREMLWVTIRSRHDHAHVDAKVSEIIIAHLMNDADMASDMCNALRALQYASHENNVRRCCNLDLLSDERDERDLMIMVSELEKRSGSFEARVAAIHSRVDTL